MKTEFKGPVLNFKVRQRFVAFIQDIKTKQLNIDERGDYDSANEAERKAKQAIDYMHANPEEFG